MPPGEPRRKRRGWFVWPVGKHEVSNGSEFKKRRIKQKKKRVVAQYAPRRICNSNESAAHYTGLYQDGGKKEKKRGVSYSFTWC